MEPFASRLLSAVGPRAAEAALLAELERLAPSTLDALESAPGPLRVVVPSSSLRIHVLAEMARRRPAWLGVEVTTLRRIALSLFERAGAAPPRGGALLPVLVRRAALREPLLARPLAPLEGGFAPLVGTVTDLIDAGLEAAHGAALEELVRSPGARIAFADRPRAEAVVRVAAQVARELDRHDAVAGAGLYRRAADLLGRAPGTAPPAALWIVHGFADATGSALDLLEAMTRSAPSLLLLDLPESSAGGARRLDEPFGAALRARLLGGRPPASAPAAGPVALDAFSALGESGEAREVARRILTELAMDPTLRPEQIGVVARDLAPYLPALRRAFESAALPFSVVGAGGAAPARRAAQALVRLFDRRELAEADLVLDLLAPALAPLAPVSDLRVALHVLGATRLDEILRIDPDVAGDVRLPIHQISDDGEAVPELRRRRVARPALAALVRSARKLARALERIAERGTSRSLLRAAARLADGALPEGGAAQTWLTATLARLAGDLPGDFPLGRDELAELLARAADGSSGASPGGAGGGVQVLSVTAARSRTFARLFVIGVHRGTFPRVVAEDPLLPDPVRREARALLPDLSVKDQGHAEERFLFDQLIAAAPRVVLSFPARSDDAKERLVSPLLDRLSWRDAATRELRERWRSPVEAAGPPATPRDRLLAAGLAGDRPRWAAALPAALAESRGAAFIAGADEALAALRCATLGEIDPDRKTPEGRRRLRQLGPFFGRVGRGALREELLWVTRVQDLLGCGWMAFLGAQLGLEPLPDASRALPHPLDARLVGTGVHRLLERTLAARLGVPRAKRLDEALARGVVEVGFPSDEELAAEARLVGEALLAEEGLTRWGFETLFSRTLAEHARAARVDWVRGARQVVGVELEAAADLAPLGTPRQISFRADRVDVEGERLVLVDYKVWSPEKLAERAGEGKLAARIATGRDLQPATYVAALGGRPATGRFLALGPAPDGDPEAERALAVDEGSQAELAALARAVAIAAAANDEGRLLPRLVDPTGESRGPACSYCRVLEACLQEDSGARLRLARWAEDRRREGVEGLDPAARAEAEIFLVADPGRREAP